MKRQDDEFSQIAEFILEFGGDIDGEYVSGGSQIFTTGPT